MKTKKENKDPNVNKEMNEVCRKSFMCKKGGFNEGAV
jgi:hypothetical protein